MSAILSADDLNDFISPGVACIKPVEPLPKQDLSVSRRCCSCCYAGEGGNICADL